MLGEAFISSPPVISPLISTRSKDTFNPEREAALSPVVVNVPNSTAGHRAFQAQATDTCLWGRRYRHAPVGATRSKEAFKEAFDSPRTKACCAHEINRVDHIERIYTLSSCVTMATRTD